MDIKRQHCGKPRSLAATFMTLRKTSIFVLFILSTMFAVGQDLTVPTTNKIDTSLRIRFKCPRTLTDEEEPLIIFNDKYFSFASLDRCFFNFEDVASVNVILPKNDSVKHFERQGKNGVIIIRTKTPIIWQTSNDIASRGVLNFLGVRKRTLFVVNDKTFDCDQVLYFAKGVIQKITVTNNVNELYNDKFYKRKIFITTKDKSGS
jgi:hypothetical protein